MTRKTRLARRKGVLPTIGLIVEGDTEFAALPLLYRKKLVAGCPPLKPTNLGGVGSDVTPIAIAKMVAPKVIAHKAAERNKVVLCFDREGRDECPGQFAVSVATALTDELNSRGKSSSDVHVVIADRAFEAWLLAGADTLKAKGKFKAVPSFQCFEGELGERKEKGCRELSDLLDRPYSKTKDGPMLFEQLDFLVARTFGPGRRGSKSLDKFLRTLGI